MAAIYIPMGRGMQIRVCETSVMRCKYGIDKKCVFFGSRVESDFSSIRGRFLCQFGSQDEEKIKEKLIKILIEF